MSTSYRNWNELTYSSIQDIIDNLYNKKWLQTNASFPTTLGYLTKSLKAGSKETGDPVNLLDGVASNEQTIKSLKDYMEKESNLELEPLDNDLLNNFTKLNGLTQIDVPLSKENGGLQGKTAKGSSNEITLEFLLDRDLKILNFFEGWQQKWFIQTSTKFQLAVHKAGGGEGGEGEGYMGLTNVSIANDGTIKPLSHLALFGLIPKKIEVPKEWGPTTSVSSVPTVKVSCLYSEVLLIWPYGNTLKYQILGW